MPQPFIGEIRIFAGNFPPANWAFCNGAVLDINQNQALFQLIGTTYGGDGINNFKLPDLQGRVPIHMGVDRFGITNTLGTSAGAETVTLITQQIPQHSHVAQAQSAAGTANGPAGNVWAQAVTLNQFSAAAPNVNMNPAAIGMAGGSQPHDNTVPFLAISFIIALFGIFPSQ